MMDEAGFEALNQAVLELLRRQREMEERLIRLEAANTDLSSQAFSSIPQEEAADAISLNVTSQEEAPEAANAFDAAPKSEPRIETRVGLTVLNRVGVITLVLGVAFFFKWAVDNEWIGPTGRVLLGAVAGVVALAAADFLWRKSQQVFAQGITATGLGIIYLSVYAAFSFYQLIPSALAFGLMVSITALAYGLALRYNAVAIAALGFLGAYATPLLLSNGEDHAWFLLSYILLLGFAAMRLAKQKQWSALEWLALAGTLVLYAGWYGSGGALRHHILTSVAVLAYYALFTFLGSRRSIYVSQVFTALATARLWSDSPGTFFLAEWLLAGAGLWLAERKGVQRNASVACASFWLSAGLFFLSATRVTTAADFAGITSAFVLFLLFAATSESRRSGGLSNATDLWLTAANGPVYYVYSYLLLRAAYHQWLGLLAILVAATYAAVAFLLRKGKAFNAEAPTGLLLTLGMAVAFVTLAVPVQLAGFHITMAWALEAAALAWIGQRVNLKRMVLAAAFTLALVALRLIWFDGELYWRNIQSITPFLNGRFATFIVAAAGAFLVSYWTKLSASRLAAGEYLGAHVALLSGLTLEVLLWAQQNYTASEVVSVETVSVSILFAIYALALVSVGVARRTAINRIAGLALVGLVIVKLYFFDVWQLGRVYRIAAFVALGLLLISTSFLYSRFRPMIESLLRKDEAHSQ